MNAADRLNEIEARARAATEGPWSWVCRTSADGDHWAVFKGDTAHALASNRDGWWPDAEFIAYARTDVPWLIEQVRFLLGELAAAVADNEKKDAALRAVLDRHEPETRWQSDPDSEWSYDTPEDAAAYEEMDPAECTSFVICRECGRVEKADAERQDHGEFSGYAESLYPCPTVRAIEEALS